MKKSQKLADLKKTPAEEKSLVKKPKLAGQSPEAVEVTLDRREGSRNSRDRRDNDRRKTEEPVATERRKLERRVKVNRRRQIDPTTCERDYSDDEVAFMSAIEQYKRSSGRMFPTCSEILEVLRGLGYVKLPVAAPAEPAVAMAPAAPAVSTLDDVLAAAVVSAV